MVKWDSNRMGFMSYVKIPKKCIVFFMNYYLPMAPHCLRSEKKVHFDFEWKFWVKTSWEDPQTLF